MGYCVPLTVPGPPLTILQTGTCEAESPAVPTITPPYNSLDIAIGTDGDVAEVKWDIAYHKDVGTVQSPTFCFQQLQWQLQLMPGGIRENSTYFSLYLKAIGECAETSSGYWCQPVAFTFKLVNHENVCQSKSRREHHIFTPEDTVFGFTSFLRKTVLSEPGFLRANRIATLSITLNAMPDLTIFNKEK